MPHVSIDTAFQLVGWTGQGFFFGRFLVQWLASERAKRIVVPTIFWWMSLAGALFALVYAVYEQQIVFMASPAVNLFIYARNLLLLRRGHALGRGSMLCVAAGLATLTVIAIVAKIDLDEPPVWLVVGVVGGTCWMLRFPLQWWLAERRVEATLPPSFYWVSFVGSLFLLAYSIHTGKAVFIAGMVLGPILYGRGLVLSYRPRPTT